MSSFLFMDKGVIDLVNYFNSVGLETAMSLFWINFSDKIINQDICSFRESHPDLNGWFVKKLIDGIWLEWRYVAANKEVAALDYQYLMDL